MADEAPTPQPSWVGGTDAIVKMLLQGRQPAAQVSAEDQQNPYLRAVEQDAATDQVPSMFGGGQSNWQGAAPHNLVGASTPAKAGDPFSYQSGKVVHPSVADLLAMGQYQLHPSVEAAKQRVVQALLQRPHGIVPTKA